MKRTEKREFRRTQNARMQQMLTYSYLLSEEGQTKDEINATMSVALAIYDRCERDKRIMSDQQFDNLSGLWNDKDWAACKGVIR